MKAVVVAVNQEKALVRAFSVIVQHCRLIVSQHYSRYHIYIVYHINSTHLITPRGVQAADQPGRAEDGVSEGHHGVPGTRARQLLQQGDT